MKKHKYYPLTDQEWQDFLNLGLFDNNPEVSPDYYDTGHFFLSRVMGWAGWEGTKRKFTVATKFNVQNSPPDFKDRDLLLNEIEQNKAYFDLKARV